MGNYVLKRVINRKTSHSSDSQWVYASVPRNTAEPLPYLRYGETWSTTINPGASNELTNYGYGVENPYLAVAHAKAFDKFVDNVKANAQMGMGENLGQAQKTLGMIVDRLSMLHNIATRNWARESLRRERLRRKFGSGWRAETKRAGAWWLEAHFGWEPLIRDIYTGCVLLSEPHWPSYPAHGRGSHSGVRDRSHPRDWRWAEQDVTSIEARVRISANVRVTNPNALLASQCGLINPIGIAWELVPFSFAVDWFLPVGKFLHSYTDMAGVVLERPFTTFTDRCERTHTIQNPYDTPDNNLRKGKGYRVERRLGNPTIPGLFSRRGTGIQSAIRGATAVALLVGFLGKRP